MVIIQGALIVIHGLQKHLKTIEMTELQLYRFISDNVLRLGEVAEPEAK